MKLLRTRMKLWRRRIKVTRRRMNVLRRRMKVSRTRIQILTFLCGKLRKDNQFLRFPYKNIIFFLIFLIRYIPSYIVALLNGTENRACFFLLS